MAKTATVIYVGDASSLVKASAEAKAAIKSVQDQASKKSGLDNLPTLGGKITTALVGATPAIVGLSGALGGLTASAAAAAGGAGAVGAGALGAVGVGLGSIAAVAIPAAGQIKKVNTAFESFNQTVATSGVTAKEVAAAHAKLNAVVSQNGGKPVLDAVKAWDALGDSFAKLSAPATATMFKTLNDGLGTAGKLLPTVAAIANKSMASFSAALQGPLKMLSGNEFKGILTALGNTFTKIVGPAVDTVSKLLLAFGRIAVAASPYVVQLAKGVDGLATKFANATANSTKLNGIIGGLVGQTKAWVGLAESLGNLIFDVFSRGASSGQGMVTSLTNVVNKWDAWVTSAKGSSEITNFFQQSAVFAKQFFSALEPVVQAISVMSTGALPVYISLMSKLKGVMGPLTEAFVAYKVALNLANGATKVAQALAGKPMFGAATTGSTKAAPAAASTAAAVSRSLGSRAADAQDVYAIERSAGQGIASSLKVGLQSAGLGDVIKSSLSAALGRGAQGLMIGTIGASLSQAVGSGVKGGVGSAIKSIGTDASIGAGMGAFFGPAGIAGGAIVGGLVGTFTHFINNDAGKQGQDFANKFLAPLPAAVTKAFQKPLAQTATNVAKLQSQQTVNNATGPLGQSAAQKVQSAQVSQALLTQYFNEGFQAAQAVEKGLNSVKDLSTPIVLADFVQQLKTLPAQAQPEAAKAMLTFANGLMRSGKLPKSALATIMTGLINQFPSLALSFGDGSKKATNAFVQNLNLNAATTKLKNALAGYRTQFGDWAISTKVTAQNLNQNISKAMNDLHTIIANSSGKTRADAVAEYNKMQSQVQNTFKQMGNQVTASIGKMAGSIKAGFPPAIKAAATDLGNFASNVQSAMSNGVLSTGQGMQLIIQNTNKALKELGQKQLSPVQIDGMKLNQGKVNQLTHQGAATGGLFQVGHPNEAGRDSVPLTVGNKNIVVAPGEQVAVFNRHQIPVVNSALAPVGGLPGLFQKMPKPNYMASGGVVGGIGAMIAEANSINAKHYPYVWGGGHNASFSGPYDCSGAVSAVLHAAGLLQAPEVSGQLASYGLPGPGPVTIYANPTHTYMSIDGRFFGTHGSSGAGWFAGAPRPGFTVRHAPVGAGTGEISAPKVSGTGTIATLTRAAVNKATKAANGMLTKIFTKMTAGGGVGGGDWGDLGGSGSSAQWTQIANQLAKQHGWNSAQVQDWWKIEQIEDPSLSLTATNPSSGAYGLAQMNTGAGVAPAKQKYYQYGGNPNTMVGQLTAMANYIAQRYGQPSAALAMEATGGYAGGGLPFVGAFKNGGFVPQTGMALVHKGETVIPSFASGGSVNPNSSISQALAGTAKDLYPVDQGLANLATLLQNLQNKTAPTHTNQIAALQKQLSDLAAKNKQDLANSAKGKSDALAENTKQQQALSREAANLPTPKSGKAGDAQRVKNAQTMKDIEKQRLELEKQRTDIEGKGSTSRSAIEAQYAQQKLTIEQKITNLKKTDKSAAQELATDIKQVQVKQQQLEQLKAYKDAMASLYQQDQTLAQQAAQAWNAAQTNAINAAHDAAVSAATAAHDAATAAINNSPQAQSLAQLQAQDAAEQNAQQLASLNSAISTDQYTVAHSAGQTHVDALTQLKADQQALTDYQRQQQEQQIQADLTAAQTQADNALTVAQNAADAQQQVALNALTQQTTDYQNALDDQLSALTANLAARKITYATWAQETNAILVSYGLSVTTDPTSEQAVDAGPGPAAVRMSTGIPKGDVAAPFGAKKPNPPAGYITVGLGNGNWAFQPIVSSVKGQPASHRAAGGPVQAGYVYRVGETGPEDVVFGRQGYVMNSGRTSRNGNGGGPLVHIQNYHANGSRSAQQLADRLAFRASIGTA